jgi:hypothetical protein
MSPNRLRPDQPGSVDAAEDALPPDEIYQAPRSWTEKAYPKLIYYNRLPKGGHFAAWEQPDYSPRRSGRCSDSLRS